MNELVYISRRVVQVHTPNTFANDVSFVSWIEDLQNFSFFVSKQWKRFTFGSNNRRKTFSTKLQPENTL